MKVKEFIEILSKLDQDKEVKVTLALCERYDGEETCSDIEVKHYSETENIEDFSNNKDFYIIR